MGVCADSELRIPLDVQPVRQTMDDIQAGGVPVNQRERGAAQLFGTQQSGQRIFTEGGAASADDDNFCGESHRFLTDLNLRGHFISEYNKQADFVNGAFMLMAR